MATFIDPKCGLHPYQMKSIDVPKRCGELDGYIAATIMSVLLVCICSSSFFNMFSSNLEENSDEKKNNNENTNNSKILISICMTFICAAFLFTVLPYFSKKFKVNSWLISKEKEAYFVDNPNIYLHQESLFQTKPELNKS